MKGKLSRKDKKDTDSHNMRGRIMETVSSYKVPYVLSEDEAYRLLKSRLTTEGRFVSKAKYRQMIIWSVSVAASVMLIVAAGYWVWRSTLTNIVVVRGQHMEYNLPDGTEVSLNAESKISLHKNTFSKDRRVHMEGEAFFHVRKGSTFTIITPMADIRILGTSFNVYARDSDFKISCFTGRIQVSNNHQMLVITPGESVELQKKRLTKYPDKAIGTVSKWRNGEFYFEYTPLNVVFEEIERQYNVNFVADKWNNKFFTGSFTNKNLVDALDIVCIPMGLTYEIGSNSKIFIREKSR